jgi:outer membrane protein assembly factor BamB
MTAVRTSRVASWTLVLAAVSIASPPRAVAGDWPQWRGPDGSGTSRERALPTSWSEQQNIAWRVDLPEWGDSTPAIWHSSIFVTAQHDDKLLLLKLDKGDGRIVWTREVGAAQVARMPLRGKSVDERREQRFHRLQNMASPSPVTDGERVVVHFGNGELAAYDFAGQRLWRRNLQQDYGAYTIWWGHANSPLLVGDLVITVCMQDSLKGIAAEPSPSYVVAHDKRTGEEKWKTMRMTDANAEECDSYTTPMLVPSPRGPQVVVMGGNQLDAYDPANGKHLWWLTGIVGGRTITGPTIANGVVYVTRGMRGPLLAVKTDGEGELSARQAVAWQQTESTPDTPCPVVWGDLLFTVSDNGIAQCFDAKTGTRHWKSRLPGDYKASPVAADGRVYFLNIAGLCTVVAAGTQFEKLAENQLDDETLASPAVSDGRIYLRGHKHLYAIGAK